MRGRTGCEMTGSKWRMRKRERLLKPKPRERNSSCS